jgi:hypothetical protein
VKRQLIAVVTAAALLTLTGCGYADNSNDKSATEGTHGNFATSNVTLLDGREVTCVTWKLMNAGGVSCDWDNARTK